MTKSLLSGFPPYTYVFMYELDTVELVHWTRRDSGQRHSQNDWPSCNDGVENVLHLKHLINRHGFVNSPVAHEI